MPGPARFNPAEALDHARSLATPRRVGTPANEATIAVLAERLRSAGCVVEVTPFEFSSAGETAMVFFVLAAQALILLIFWAGTINAWAAAGPAVLLAALLLGSGQLYRVAARASLSQCGAPMPVKAGTK